METTRIEQQRHGYVSGHQLLASSTNLAREDQDVVDRLSDIAGQPGPNETIPDYLTGYPLPSGRFFAFARTWYDASAPRAGCVLTHTLLVPTAAWSSAKSLLALSRLHSPFERERSGRTLPGIDTPGPDREPYPVCQSKGLPELCEAMFLEQRQPIAWFTEPNDNAVLRLVEALWPALRAKFAFQTYALKPRSKARGMFDLMAVPRNARSRFSSWEGRRVEGDAKPRHQFTDQLVESIFGTPFPDLEIADPLGVLALDQVGDASKLRLSILWNSLRGNGKADANASLGMLDVLTAAALPEEERWKRAEPLFRQVFEVACSREGRAANLIGLALGKLEQGDGDRLSESVVRSVACLSTSEPEMGVRLAATLWRDPSAVSIVRQTVAETLTNLSDDRALDALRTGTADLAVDLIERDPRLAVELASSRSDADEDWSWLALVIARLDERTIREVRLDMLGKVESAAQVPVLRELLSAIDRQDLASAFRRLDKSGALRDDALIEALASLKNPAHREKLDALAAANLPGKHVGKAFGALLSMSAGDLDWLLGSSLAPRLKTELLLTMLATSERSERVKAGIDEASRLEAVLSVLLSSPTGFIPASELIFETDRLSERAFDLVASRFGRERSPLSSAVLASLIDSVVPLDSSANTQRLASVLDTPAGPEAATLAARCIVDLLLPEDVRDAERVYSQGLVLGARLDGILHEELLQQLPTVSARASSYRVYKLAPLAYEAWAKLVDDAVVLEGDVAQRAAEGALAYVFRKEFETLELLAQASFPTAFNAMLASPSKTRRDAMRLAEEMCRLFIRHRWNGAEFIRMVIQTENPQMVLEAAADCWHGVDYLRASFEKLGVRLSKKELRSHDLSAWHVEAGRAVLSKA